jgi:hypothetical protein
MQKHSDLIGTVEACRIINEVRSVDRATLTRWVAAEKITSHKLPGRTGAHLFSRREIEALRDELAAERAEQSA